MVLQMVRPWKLDSGIFDVRLRIPADVRTVASNRQISRLKEAGGVTSTWVPTTNR